MHLDIPLQKKKVSRTKSQRRTLGKKIQNTLIIAKVASGFVKNFFAKYIKKHPQSLVFV
jgi:hypothetical protein